MTEANPFELEREIKATLQAYLPTTLLISHRYPTLRSQFRELIQQTELVKGPYVEALPDFEKGRPLERLLEPNGGFLHPGMKALPQEWLSRPLHLHQERALTQACVNGKNLVVATGTGSGKTECFLFPLVNALLRSDIFSPGVRFLLVYPMNALANDQLYYRIAPLLALYLKDAGITFGRFTGQIRANTRRDEEEQRLLNNEKLMAALGNPRRIPENWLLTREEMFRTPPHVLVTNYAMLEHLLLLPRNAPLFERNKLTAVVLDEVHSYAGAQATEIAFLLRKLKHRLEVSHPIQCFATSASLPQSADADRAITKFASDLFGEPFESVIRGRRIMHTALQQPVDQQFGLNSAEWLRVGAVLAKLAADAKIEAATWDEFKEAVAVTALDNLLIPAQLLPLALFEAFCKNNEIQQAAKILDAGGVSLFAALADEVIHDSSASLEHKAKALAAVFRVGMLARSAMGEFPLLPARYHLAANTIEGICVSLSKDSPEGWQSLRSLRNYQDETGLYYPLLVCRKCGQPFLEGYEQDGRILNRATAGAARATRRVFWLGRPPAERTADENDSSEEIEIADDESRYLVIDPITGVKITSVGAGCLLYEVEMRIGDDELSRFVLRCPACGGSTGTTETEVLTRMHPGNEALGSVITQKVLEAMPSQAERSRPVPFGGRGLLGFSDNRQNAAFFAPYLERTSRELAARTAFYQVAKQAEEVLDLNLLADRVLRHWKSKGQPVLLDGSGDLVTDRMRQMDLLIGQAAVEFCTPGGKRTSLDALGLVDVTYGEKYLKPLRSVLLDLLQGWRNNDLDALLHFLLETIRREKAITNLWDVDLTDPFIWSPAYKAIRTFSLFKEDRVRYAWLTRENVGYHNRRTHYLIKQLKIPEDEARAILSEFWEAAVSSRILLAVRPGYALDARSIQVRLAADRPLFICQSCGLRQRHVVQQLCTAFKCSGKTVELSESERSNEKVENHYIRTYEADQFATLRAREHTASLSTELREEIESEFADGLVNVLSCTTTMEMGVDLGDLEAVINLNIPPGISNYQQRTGRAGRRAQAAPFCVTVARSTPYDQAVFADLHGYLEQPAPIPCFRLDNPTLFRRHQMSVLLSYYLRYRILDVEINAPSLRSLFGESFGDEQLTAFLDDLHNWIEGDGRGAVLAAAGLTEHLPLALREGVGSRADALRATFLERLGRFALEVNERWNLYTAKCAEADTLTDVTKKGKSLTHWDGLRRRYMEQFLVTQLSHRGLIPTYSFPIHSLTLEVTRQRGPFYFPGSASDISLSRDASLGISEYAPGAQVVAAGRVWESAGVMRYPRIFMPDEPYCVCQTCQHVDVALEASDLPDVCSNCGEGVGRWRRTLIEPRGFVTGYGDRKGKDPGMVRRRERPADEARLIALPRDDVFSDTDHPKIRYALLAAESVEAGLSGEMVVLNRGPKGFGYHVCRTCNFAVAAKKPAPVREKHRQPLSDEWCLNQQLPLPIDLAHRFATDVLILRILEPLPEPSLEQQANNHLEGLSRTITEALRFAAADLLELMPTEVRGTYRRNGRRLDVILYDSVSGGAGYTKRLKDMPVMSLMGAALSRLSCANMCASACTSCLCDYTNQQQWDQLDRTMTYPWLKALIDQSLPGPFAHLGAALWANPSLSVLAESLHGVKHVNVFTSRMGMESAEQETVRRWITNLLETGADLTIYVANAPTLSPLKLSARARDTIRHLYPYIKSGKLSMKVAPNMSEASLGNIPRIWYGSADGGHAWLTDAPSTPLLDSVIPPSIYRTDHSDKLELCLAPLAGSKPVQAKDFEAGLPVEMYHLTSNDQEARVNQVFSDLNECYVERLIIKDPYVTASSKNTQCLIQLLKHLGSIAKSIEKIDVTSRELNPKKDDRWVPFQEVQGKTQDELQALQVNVALTVLEFRRSYQFHDRTIDAVVVDAEGQSVTLRYDLTGGIDHLMDRSRETKVFRYRVDS